MKITHVAGPYKIVPSVHGTDMIINVRRIEAILPADAYGRLTLIMESGERLTLHQSISFDEMVSYLKDNISEG